MTVPTVGARPVGDPQTPDGGSAAAVATLAVAAQHQAQQEAERSAIVSAILALWSGVRADELIPSWYGDGIRDKIYISLSAGQEHVAAQATDFVGRALAAQGIPVSVPDLRPLGFAGIASDGRSLEDLLDGSLVRVWEALQRGLPEPEALRSGGAFLTTVAATQISDAARAADQTAIVAATPTDGTSRTKIGWVRKLSPPSCSRCIVLAGAFFRWNDGFERHPMCDCKHIPVAEHVAGELTADADKYFASLTEADQNYYFGKANAQAIRDGASISQVVNATTRKGAMFTADDGRRYTKEGITKRGVAGRRGVVLRPTPVQIYRDAKGDRDAAIEALRTYGYIA